MQFQIEKLYSDGLNHLELPDLSRKAETFNSSRNRSSATKNVGACDAGLFGEAPNACPARRTSSD